MRTATSKIRFDKAGYYFIGLVALVLLGFWKSYFSLFFKDVTNDYAFYFHFHATMVSLWVLMLIVQPILIRKKKLNVHRFIGKFSYAIMPLLLLSIILIENYTGKLSPDAELTFTNYVNSLSDALKVLIFFVIAIWGRHNVSIHARAMVCTGIAFIGPALVRFLANVHIPNGYIVYAVMICSLLVTLIIIERKQKIGRWIFPLMLGLSLANFILAIYQIQIPVLDPAVKWIVKLPLTPSPIVKDLLIPQNEIDSYIGEWEDEYGTVTYKKEKQLWIHWTEKGNPDSTRLLYQGDGKFIADKYRSLSLYFKLKDGKAEAFSNYYAYIYGGTSQRKK